jgi:hypothetical protein
MTNNRGIKRVKGPGKVHNACFNCLGGLPQRRIRI